jgi:hypothetical protein
MKNDGKLIRIKLNMPLRGYLAGTVLKLGPGFAKLDKYWIHKLKDSKIDGAITVLTANGTPAVQAELTRQNRTTETSNLKKSKSNQVRVDHGNK